MSKTNKKLLHPINFVLNSKYCQ